MEIIRLLPIYCSTVALYSCYLFCTYDVKPCTYCNNNIIPNSYESKRNYNKLHLYTYKVVCRSEMFSNRTVDCFGVCLWRPIYTNFSYQWFMTHDKSKLTIRSRIPRGSRFSYTRTAQQPIPTPLNKNKYLWKKNLQLSL